MTDNKNILVLTQWSYKDPLIQAYTLPYVYIIADQVPPGSKIYLVTSEQDKLKMNPEEKEKIKLLLNEKGIVLEDYSYSSFGMISFVKWFFQFLYLLTLIFIKRIKYIHAWCTPAGSMGYILSIFSGKQLIIDSYEPHAEAMVENQTWSGKGFKFKLLFYLEKKLSRRAKILISTTNGMYDYAIRKYGIKNKINFVKPACVDLSRFNIAKRKNPELMRQLQLENKTVCVYAGKFGGIYLTKEVFDFFHEAEKAWDDNFRVLLLTPHSKTDLINMAVKSNFNPEKMIILFVPHEKIPDYLGLGDFGITPVKPLPAKKFCTPIKDGEYWAMGLPVVITNDISDDSEIISKNNAGAVLKDLSPESYREAIDVIKKLLGEKNETLTHRIRNLALQFRSFKIAEDIYRAIYKESR